MQRQSSNPDSLSVVSFQLTLTTVVLTAAAEAEAGGLLVVVAAAVAFTGE
jgi:hypothetical protein